MIAKSIIKRFFCLCQLCKVRRRLSEKVEWVQTLLKSERMDIGKRRISAIGVVRLSKQVWRDMIMQSGATQVENREDG